MKLSIKKQTKGFTIIEVLIVLAIAATIILIALQAVPALNRNSRNTKRKTDIANLVSAINEYAGNNSGTLPTAASDMTANVKFQQYSTSSVTSSPLTASGTVANPNSDTAITVVPGGVCDTSTTNVGGATYSSARNFVVLYTLEGSPAKQCQLGA